MMYKVLHITFIVYNSHKFKIQPTLASEDSFLMHDIGTAPGDR